MYERLARLLEYPREDLVDVAREAGEALISGHADAAVAVDEFAGFVRGKQLSELEELYTATFDILAPCCIDVGYQLFGETYKRGQFIVKMRVALREAGIAETGELPDHLPMVLRLVGLVKTEKRRLTAEDAEEEQRTQKGDLEDTSLGVRRISPSALSAVRSSSDAGDTHELVREAVLPAIVKMEEGLAGKPNPYAAVLRAVRLVLCADFAVAEIAPPPIDLERRDPPGAQGSGVRLKIASEPGRDLP